MCCQLLTWECHFNFCSGRLCLGPHAQAALIGLGGLATAALAVCGIFKIRDEIIKASIDRKAAEAAARKAEDIAANPEKARIP